MKNSCLTYWNVKKLLRADIKYKDFFVVKHQNAFCKKNTFRFIRPINKPFLDKSRPKQKY